MRRSFVTATVDFRIDELRFPSTRFLMSIIANYSLEFGVVLRAVCPTPAGLDG